MVKSIFGLGRGARASWRLASWRRLSLFFLYGMGKRVRLFDFSVQGAAAEKGVVFLFLHFLGLLFFVSGSHIARRWFSFGSGFCAFDGDDFARHDLLLLVFVGVGCVDVVCFISNFHRRRRSADGVDGAECANPPLLERAILF